MHIEPSMIHPELRKVGAIMRFLLPSFTERKFRLAKTGVEALKGRSSGRVQYEQLFVPRADGSRLRLCIYSPHHKQASVPGLLWLHGGGYAMGTPEQDEAFIERFIEASACVVVAPDYRLSLDAPYPAALEDSYAALLWLREHGETYGMRSDQLMVGGNSAGGGLGAGLCLHARDRGEVAIAYQILLYPMLDDRMKLPSARDNDGPVWNSKSNQLAWKLYLGNLYGREDVPIYAAPARSSDVSGLPPVCSYVGSLEPFHDEVVDYLDRLRTAGVPVSYRVYEGCYHGFDVVCPDASVSQEARAFLLDRFRLAAEQNFAAQPQGK